MQHNVWKKKYINTLHIHHNQGPSKEADVKLLTLVVPSIGSHQSHGNCCSHMNANTYIQLRNVAEEYNVKMKNLNAPLDLWHQIVQN